MSSHSLGAAVDNLCTLSLPRPGCNSLRTPNRSESGRPPHAHADFGPARQVVSIASRMTPADMAHRACLRQLVANKPATLRGDPGGVHQMWVALRRLRAAISLPTCCLIRRLAGACEHW